MNLERILNIHLEFFDEISRNIEVNNLLKNEGVSILPGFNLNILQVRNFYRKYYRNSNTSRVVLCGINPGKKGTGKTGIPFIDSVSASYLLPNVEKEDKWEPSSEFIFSVIKEIGFKNFFNNLYLTNISWFGFIKDNKNHNYSELPSYLPDIFTSNFIEEMRIVKPKIIIPLSKDVERTLKEMKEAKRIDFDIAPRLNHPRWCNID